MTTTTTHSPIPAYSVPMMEMDCKRAHMDATSNLKGRDASGRARKS